jgi:hypothetical protein
MHKILEGELGRVALADLLALLAGGRCTAVLVLEREDRETKLFLRTGQPVFAVSSDGELRLGRLLVRQGRLRQADVDAAMRKTQAGARLGQVLLAGHLLSEVELSAALKVQVSEAIYDAFAWTTGTFTVYDGVPPPATAVTLDGELHSLIMEGVRRLDLRARAEELKGALDQVLEALPNPERVKHKVVLTHGEWQVFFLIDGRRTLRDIARLMGVEHEGHTLLTIARLLAARFVALAGLAPAGAGAEALPEGGEDSTRLALGGGPGPAVEVATGVRARAPHDDTRQVVSPEAVEYLADARRVTVSRLIWLHAEGETSFPLGREAHTLGRHRNNDIVVGDPKVSSFHARIDRSGEGFTVQDLGSRNGTFVNGRRITSVALEDGNELRLGTARLLYKVDFTSEL